MFNKTNPEVINKLWLQTQIEEYYNPSQQQSELPKELIKYFQMFFTLLLLYIIFSISVPSR